jgi:hypothetical protein
LACPAAHLAERLQALAGLLGAQFGWLGLLAALFGLFFGRVLAPRVHLMLAWVAAAFTLFALGYWAADSDAYLIPAFLALAVWLGLETATALESVRGGSVVRIGLAGLLGASLLWGAAANLPRLDASRATEAEAFGRAMMAEAPPRALLLAQEDRDAFTLWYVHFALGQRPDVSVVVEPLLLFDWYRENLAAVDPALTVPAQPSSSRCFSCQAGS